MTKFWFKAETDHWFPRPC